MDLATTITSTAITATVNGVTMFFVIRYLSKFMEKVDKNGKGKRRNTKTRGDVVK